MKDHEAKAWGVMRGPGGVVSQKVKDHEAKACGVMRGPGGVVRQKVKTPRG